MVGGGVGALDRDVTRVGHRDAGQAVAARVDVVPARAGTTISRLASRTAAGPARWPVGTPGCGVPAS